MRPAQKAPENTEIMLNSLERDINFNEAGAKSAGKRGGPHPERREPCAASMRPAQKAPENGLDPRLRRREGTASMRPAQKAPENPVPPPSRFA